MIDESVEGCCVIHAQEVQHFIYLSNRYNVRTIVNTLDRHIIKCMSRHVVYDIKKCIKSI